MKENLGTINLPFRSFVANLRNLLQMPSIRNITGRPPKSKPPDPTLLLPGFPA